MTRVASRVVSICNLRTLFVVATLWLLCTPVPPSWLQRPAGSLDQTLFRAGMHFMSLPELTTQITLIHVPGIEFDRWVADLSGASRLLQVFDMSLHEPDAKRSGTIVGLLGDSPFSLIQPETESLLAEVQQGRSADAPKYADVADALVRRERLMAYLRSPNTVLGLMDRFSSQQRLTVQEDTGVQGKSGPLVGRLQPSPPKVSADLSSPVLPYAVIPHTEFGKPHLLVRDEGKLVPTFWIHFLTSDFQSRRPDAAPKPLLRHIPEGLVIDEQLIPTGRDSGVIPVYGAFSGIRAPMRQITLGAALKLESLSGWILLGRDGGERLDNTAQVMASLADRAYLIEPLWWVGGAKALLLCLGAIIYFIVPRMSFRWLLTFLAGTAGGLVILQILGQAMAGYWLPTGVLLIYTLVGSSVVLIWRWQRAKVQRIVQRADNVSFALADGLIESKQWLEALTLVKRCSSSSERAAQLERIASLAEQFHHWQAAAQAWGALKSFNLNYRKYAAKQRACLEHLQTDEALPPQEGGVDRAWQGSSGEHPGVKLRVSFGKYQVKRLLGQGVHGRLYLGYSSGKKREVLIKTPYVGFIGPDQPLKQSRLFRDLQLITQLSHPVILPVLDVGEESGVAYMVTDKPGLPRLSRWLATDRRLPVYDAYCILLSIAEALDHAHHHGCVHRNIRPDCIYYSHRSQQVLLTDFGLQGAEDLLRVRVDDDINVIAPYLSPEQVLGQDADVQSDIFSLGVVFYQLLTGRLPFSGNSLATLSHNIVHVGHPTARSLRPSLPASATRITDVALRKNPSERFSSAKALQQSILQAIKRDFSGELRLDRSV